MTVGIRLSPKPRWIQVEMPYPGSVISVNHYRGRRKDGGEYVKSEAQSWMDMLGWQLKQHHIEEWKLPLTVSCDGEFKDARSAPDLSNLSKCTLDAIQEATGVNDRDMRWSDGNRSITGTIEPKLIIKIRESEE